MKTFFTVIIVTGGIQLVKDFFVMVRSRHIGIPVITRFQLGKSIHVLVELVLLVD